MQFILSLPHSQAFKLVEKAFDKDLEERAWQMWRAMLMRGEQVKPFNEYLESVKKPKPIDTRTEDEILEDVEGILKMKV